jgi:hypothetical protein
MKSFGLLNQRIDSPTTTTTHMSQLQDEAWPFIVSFKVCGLQFALLY